MEKDLFMERVYALTTEIRFVTQREDATRLDELCAALPMPLTGSVRDATRDDATRCGTMRLDAARWDELRCKTRC